MLSKFYYNIQLNDSSLIQTDTVQRITIYLCVLKESLHIISLNLSTLVRVRQDSSSRMLIKQLYLLQSVCVSVIEIQKKNKHILVKQTNKQTKPFEIFGVEDLPRDYKPRTSQQYHATKKVQPIKNSTSKNSVMILYDINILFYF